MISFSTELGSVMHRLVRSPDGARIPFELTNDHYPFFLQGLASRVRSAHLAVRMRDGSPPDLTLRLDDTAVSEWTASPTDRGGLASSADLAAAFAGGPIGQHSVSLTTDTPERIEDILLFVTLGVD
ncbi:MAG: hypothetical protein AB7S26_04205 [Sandaracinaceae bacterium]